MSVEAQPNLPNRARTQPAHFAGHWLWGNLRQFREDRLGTLTQAAQLGRVVHMRFLNSHAYLLSHPDDIKHVLVDNHRNYIKGYGVQALKPVLGDGLLNSENPLHQRQRRLIQPAFHRQRIAAYGEIIARIADEHLAGWQDGQSFDLHEELMQMTMVIVAKCLFDEDVSNDAGKLGQAINALIQEFNFNRIGPIGQFLARFDRSANRRRDERLRVLDSLLYEMIRNRRAEAEDRGDLLSMLLSAQDEELGADGSTSPSSAMSDQQLRDELITLFIAGHETTAIAITWTFYLLAQHPEVEARLHTELDALLGDPLNSTARLPTWDDLPKLEVTRRVFSEAMRIYPPVWSLSRLALHDDEIAGCPIRAGSGVIISQYVTHHDAHYWPDPERFDPDRFAPEAEAQRTKYAYLPFGGGPRRCIGEPFAWMEGELLVAAIAHRFRVHLQLGYVAEMLPLITLRPQAGMPVSVRLRSSQETF